jgi:hypothetical protein
VNKVALNRLYQQKEIIKKKNLKILELENTIMIILRTA